MIALVTVDPSAWLLLLPLLVGMLVVRRLPAEHELTRFWTELTSSESHAFWVLGLRPMPGAGSTLGRSAYWVIVVALVAASVLSLWAWYHG